MIETSYGRLATTLAVTLLFGCASGKAVKSANPAVDQVAPAQDRPARPPAIVPINPRAGRAGTKSPGLVALEEELHRAMTELGKIKNQPPYFIGYEVHDRREINISASDGALLSSTDQRNRTLSVDVRVGSHKLDSNHPLRGGMFAFDLESMVPMPVALPLEDVPAAIRAVAWAETDRRYKAASENFLKVQSERKIKATEEDLSDDFSRDNPVAYIEPPATVDLDAAAWETRVRRISARFRDAPDIRGARVSLEVSSVNRWITNSDGGSIQTGRGFARISIQAGTRAEDGMDLERHETFDAGDVSRLPDEVILARAADTIVADLRALREAPLADPFVGPAILEGRAAAVFFHEIFGHRVEGHRQKNDVEGQTFAKKVGKMVMPSFMSVYDDPGVARIGDEDLNGTYRFDDEGVAAQRASLVEGGVLKGFLMGRSPIRNFNHSFTGRTFIFRDHFVQNRGWFDQGLGIEGHFHSGVAADYGLDFGYPVIFGLETKREESQILASFMERAKYPGLSADRIGDNVAIFNGGSSLPEPLTQDKGFSVFSKFYIFCNRKTRRISSCQ